jgi:hypothetical protein
VKKRREKNIQVFNEASSSNVPMETRILAIYNFTFLTAHKFSASKAIIHLKKNNKN